MKVIAFNGSARKDGNTALLIGEVFKELEKEGIGTEMVQLAGKKLRGCMACYRCVQNADGKCVVTDDEMNDYIARMAEADGMILASPTYFADMSANLKALIERSGLVGMANGGLFRRKVGAPVVAVRRGGATHVFSTINYFFLINEMVIPGSSYWNFGIGREPGEVMDDEEGLRTMRNLGKNMAWLLKKLE